MIQVSVILACITAACTGRDLRAYLVKAVVEILIDKVLDGRWARDRAYAGPFVDASRLIRATRGLTVSGTSESNGASRDLTASGNTVFPVRRCVCACRCRRSGVDG